MATIKPRDAIPALAIVTGLTIVLGAMTTLVHDHLATRHPDAAGGAHRRQEE